MFSHHLAVGLVPSDFIFLSVQRSCLRVDGEIWRSRKVVYLLKYKIMKFTCVILQPQDDGAYPLGLDDPPN